MTNILKAMAAVSACLALCSMSGGAAAQDETATVDAVTAIASMLGRPITNPEWEALSADFRGVPQYSAEQVASYVCEATSTSGRARANASLTATEAFETAKEAYRNGAGTLEEMVRANSARQAALTRMVTFDTMGLSELQKTRFGAFTIQATDFRVETVRNEQILIVKVVVTNTGRSAGTAPEITLKALDRGDRILRDATYDLNLRVEGGSSATVEIPFLNMPLYTYDVRAHFGPGSYAGYSRGCAATRAYHAARAPIEALTAAEIRTLNMLGAGGTGESAAPTHADVQLVASRWVGEGAGRVLEIDAAIRNTGRDALPLPTITILIMGEGDQEVGQVSIPADGTMVPPNTISDVTMAIGEADPLPAAGGQNPLGLMKRLAVRLN